MRDSSRSMAKPSRARARMGPSAFALVALAALATTLIASGCSSIYTESASAGAGIGGAAIASKVTNNAAVATGIGLGAVAAARAGVQYTERVSHNFTQDQIARAAGPLTVGVVASWSVKHTVPLEPNQHGRVTVSRIISSGALDCKEIVFSVDEPASKQAASTQQPAAGEEAANTKQPATEKPTSADVPPAQSEFYVASICRDGSTWKWATAEPATGRWSPLQ